jgi:hypothetical protein
MQRDAVENNRRRGRSSDRRIYRQTARSGQRVGEGMLRLVEPDGPGAPRGRERRTAKINRKTGTASPRVEQVMAMRVVGVVDPRHRIELEV